MNLSPSAFSKYIESQPEYVSKEIAQFRARFRIARAYAGSSFNGVADESQLAYSELIRAGLVYSAVETFGVLRDGSSWQNTLRIIDAERANSFRGTPFKKMNDMLQENLNPKNRKRHAEFLSGATDNLLLILGPIRHMIFHGNATAYGSGLATSPAAQMTLNETSEWVLEHLDNLFTDFVHEMAYKKSKGLLASYAVF